MKQNVTLGVVCLARKTFDFNAAFDIFKKICGELKTIPQVNWEIIPELVIEVEDAQNAAKMLATKAIDGLVVMSGTFSLGHLVLELNKVLTKPILLWGLNELPYDGGKIRLNSVCGVNLNASNLYKAGVKTFWTTVGDKIDQDWIDAIRVIRAFKTAHIGIIGYRAHGFFNLDVDELDLYRQVGILLDHYELQDVFNSIPEPAQINLRKEQVSKIFNISGVNATQVEKVATLAAKFDTFMQKNKLSAIAIRCWPEFAAEFGISPCAAMSLLQSEGKILTCEGDLLGSLSMVAHQAVGGETPFLADFSQVNFEQDFALLWHCGVAPCNLWDGKCDRSLHTYFAGGKGVTADFVLKEGPVSLLRIDYAPGEYRMLLHTGTAIPMTKDLRGTYAKTTFPGGVKGLMDKIVYNGIAHHISVVYGNFIKMFEIYGRIMGWSVIK